MSSHKKYVINGGVLTAPRKLGWTLAPR